MKFAHVIFFSYLCTQNCEHMENVNEQNIVVDESRQSVARVLMRNVYLWMTGGLSVTAAMAWYVANTPELFNLIYGNRWVYWSIIIAEIVFIVGLSGNIRKMHFMTALLLYLAYCVVNGAFFSAIFVEFDLNLITQVFMVTAGSFVALAVAGSFTKKDLTGMGTFLTMALFGLIIATVIGLVMGNPRSIWISIIGVIIFSGLTAYDAQKIRQMMLEEDTLTDGNMKLALLGALTLYLDFINLFIQLLSLLGNKNND